MAFPLFSDLFCPSYALTLHPCAARVGAAKGAAKKRPPFTRPAHVPVWSARVWKVGGETDVCECVLRVHIQCSYASIFVFLVHCSGICSGLNAHQFMFGSA